METGKTSARFQSEGNSPLISMSLTMRVTGSERIYALFSVPQRWSILRYQYIQDGDVQDIPQHQVNFNQSHRHDKLKKSNTKRMQGWSRFRLAMFSRT